MRLVEFFCGIGGVAEAVRQLAWPVTLEHAIDIDQACGVVYQYNFGKTVEHRAIEAMPFPTWASEPDDAEVWWLSPPCQPYCRRGRGQPAEDRRCDAIRNITRWFETGDNRLPRRLALENVPEFQTSADAGRLRSALAAAGYASWEGNLCPSELGIPNRRLRFYLIASRDGYPVEPPDMREDQERVVIADILEEQLDDDVWLSPDAVHAYKGAMDLVDASDSGRPTACFASGYGRSMIRSGSYVKVGDRVRRFTPREVARLLGFSEAFGFPASFTNRQRWKMLGNSLSVPVVKRVLVACGVS